MSRPASRIVPASTLNDPATAFRVVLLPEPFVPITTTKLHRGGTFEVRAEFIPSVRGYARSSVLLTVTTGPTAVSSFRITAPHYYGAPGTPITFTVTALDSGGQPISGYTGTVHFSSSDAKAVLQKLVAEIKNL